MSSKKKDSEEVLFSESKGAFAPTIVYSANISVNDALKISEKSVNGHISSQGERFTRKILIALRNLFLPYGYPNSVSKDYVPYQIWDTIQALASTITGSLATEAVLKGVGVGDETATPVAAATTWLIKNGSGHIGRILFAYIEGTSLDHDCKKWRLVADILNDFATVIDLLVPLFPSELVVFILCFSSIARSIVGVAGGATRAAVTQHQARNNNMADVSAKDGSQETLVNLLGLIASLIILPFASGNYMIVWTLFTIFTFIHLFSNYKAVRSLQFETFNINRLLICLKDYLNESKVSSIHNVNLREPVLFRKGVTDLDLCGYQIKLGVSLQQVLKSRPNLQRKHSLETLIMETKGKPFIIVMSPKDSSVFVILEEKAKHEDIIEAYVRSVLVAYLVRSSSDDEDNDTSKTRNKNKMSIDAKQSSSDEMKPMEYFITKEWDNFKHLASSQGFSFSQASIAADEWRSKWRHS